MPTTDAAATFLDEPTFGGVPRVPLPFTSFVGREDDLARAAASLDRGRLLSVTGPGGVGKSRLVRELTATLPSSSTEVRLVDLRAVDPDADVVDAVCAGLGLIAGRSAWAKLTAFLDSGPVLVVLDNCEHLVGPCRDLVVRMLGVAEGVRVVVASREVLGVLGEEVLVLGPLSLPTSALEPAATLRASGAVRLFEDRARAVDPEFVVDELSAPEVSEVCARVDGIPLAIELAAAWLPVLGLSELVRRLEDRFTLLDRGHSADDARRRSLRETVRWSYELCGEPARALWRQLAVFRGGCDLHAIEVLASRAAGDQPEDLLVTVRDLVDKSILRREQDSSGARYTMLDTVAEFGVAQSSPEEARRIGEQHARYFAEIAGRFEVECLGRHQTFWVARAWTDRMNFAAALRWLTAEGDGGAALRMARSLWFHWFRTDAGEGLRLMRAAVGRYAPLDADHALTLGRLAVLTTLNGHPATDDLARARAMAAEVAPGADRDRLEVELLNLEAIERTLRNDIVGAAEAGARSCALADRHGVARSRFAALAALTPALEAADPEAEEECDAMATRAREDGDHHSEALAHYYRAMAARIRGDLPVSETHALRVLDSGSSPTNLLVLPTSLMLLSESSLRRGQAERAAQLLGGAVRLAERTGCDPTVVSILVSGIELEIREALGATRSDAASARGTGLATEELLALAVDRSEDAETAAPAMSTLTRRERDVARLVVRGQSNREIASTLFLSTRTVEGHVANILDKLGLQRRAQVASRLRVRS